MINIDVPVITGIKRQIQANDKPPYFSSYIRDMRQRVAGVWSKREGLGKYNPDRSHEYEYINPLEERAISSPFDSERIAFSRINQLYNSHRRKTIALGDNGGTKYVFAAVVQNYFWESTDFQRLLIYRGTLQENGVTVAWEQTPTYSEALGQVERKRGSMCFIEYSMVMNNDKTALYIVLTLRDSLSDLHSIVHLVKLTNLYADTWMGDGGVTWTLVDQTIYSTNSGTEYASNDLDLDIDENGDIHVIWGMWDESDWIIKSIKFQNDEIAETDEFSGIGMSPVGMVIKINGDTVHATYLNSYQQQNTVHYRSWNINQIISQGASVLISTGWADINLLRQFQGPALCVDGLGNISICYKKESMHTLFVRVKRVGEEEWLDEVKIADNVHSRGYGISTFLPTNWDMAVKNNLTIVYYVAERYRMGELVQSVFRRSLIHSTTDSDYNSLVPFPLELVESGIHPNHVYTYLTAYELFESDSPKRLTTIKYEPYSEMVDGAWVNGQKTYFNYIRQDVGIRDGAAEVAQQAVHNYNSTTAGGTANITVVQCRLTSADRYLWFKRGYWQWTMLKGQMDEDNGRLVQSTEVSDDGARFWDKFGTLRAGCGNDKGEIPIVYAYADRQYYRNESWYKRQDSRFRLTPLTPPDLGLLSIGDGVLVPSLTAVEIFKTFVDRQNLEGLSDVYKRFFDESLLDDDALIVVYDNDGAGTIKGGRVNHPYKYLKDFTYAETYFGPNLWYESVRPPFIEVFLGFAYRYDDYQISQIAPQTNDEPYKLGIVMPIIINDATYRVDLYSHIEINVRLVPWNLTMPSAMDPRITGFLILMGIKSHANKTKWDVNYKLWKEIRVAKPSEDPFKDEPEHGDSQWTSEWGGRIMHMRSILDYGAYQRTYLTAESASEYIGSGIVTNRNQNQSICLDGYKQAVVGNDRSFYIGVRLNDKKMNDIMFWGTDRVEGRVNIVADDVISPANSKSFPFNITGGGVIGADNIVLFGDTNIEWGRVIGDVLQWRFTGAKQDLGTFAKRSITKVEERGEIGGLFFLAESSYGKADGGGRIFNLYESHLITDDIQEDYVQGINSAGLQTFDTYHGIRSLTLSDAIAIHLPVFRLLLLHFPNAQRTFVRDYNAESHDRYGTQWTEWRLGRNPRIWCQSPKGYLIFSDGTDLYRWPAAADTGLDDGVTISPQGCISSIRIPPRSEGEFQSLEIEYKAVGSGVNFIIIRDDGKRPNISASFSASAVKTRKWMRLGWQKPVKEEFSLWWSLAAPGTCTAFDLHSISTVVEKLERREV